MSKHTRTIQQRANSNRQPCEVPYCGSLRVGVHRFCGKHLNRFRLYGDPRGRRLLPRDWRYYRAHVGALFAKWPNHPGVTSAQEFFRAWMDHAAAGANVPAAAQLARLKAQCVTPGLILETVAAVWMKSHKEPRTLPDTARDFAIANAMFELAPRQPRRTYTGSTGRIERRYPSIPRADRAAAGAHIRLCLALFLQHVATSADPGAMEAAEQEARRAMLIPFGTNLSIPLNHR